MERHPGHLDRRAARTAAGGQRDVEQPCRALGILEEQLVEIPHPIKQQQLRVLRLQTQVLLHHGRVLLEGLGVDRGGRGHVSGWRAG